MTDYDCTQDVLEHKERVEYWMRGFANLIQGRAENHDNSKLKDPVEKAMFDYWVPNLKRVEFGSEEYKQALEGMGGALKRHYAANRHHPEHYENGVNGMTLHDVVEMVCDWMAAAQAKNTHIDLVYLALRFGLSEQLAEIIANTLREEDIWNKVGGVPVGDFCPPDRQDDRVEGFERAE